MDTLQAIREAEARGAEVCWDITHGLLSPWASDVGPVRVGSLRKWCGLPDGAFLTGITPGHRPPRPLHDSDDFLRARLRGMTCRAHHLQSGAGAAVDFLTDLSRAEDLLARYSGVRGMSRSSHRVLDLVDVDEMASARRRNATALLEALQGASGVVPLIDVTGRDSVPFCVPLACDDRDGLRGDLLSAQVFTPVHWRLPPQVSDEAFPGEHALSERILSIPCDQRFTVADMRRVAALILHHSPRPSRVG